MNLYESGENTSDRLWNNGTNVVIRGWENVDKTLAYISGNVSVAHSFD